MTESSFFPSKTPTHEVSMHPSIQFAAQVFADLANTLPLSARSAFQQISQMHLQELIKVTQPAEAKPAAETEGSVK